MSVVDEPTGPVAGWVPWSAAADEPPTGEVPAQAETQTPAQTQPPAETGHPQGELDPQPASPDDEGFPRRGPFRVLVVGAGAVAAVAVGITAMNVAARHQSTAGGGPTVAPAAAPVPTAVPTSVPGAEDARRTHAVLPPVVETALPSETASAAASASAASGSAASGAAAGPVPAVSVTVLNSTSVRGLAAAEGARLTADGWQVRRVTSVDLPVPETTVYYDSDQAEAARTLLARVPSIRAMKPRPLLLRRTGGLIVVVAADAR